MCILVRFYPENTKPEVQKNMLNLVFIQTFVAVGSLLLKERTLPSRLYFLLFIDAEEA